MMISDEQVRRVIEYLHTSDTYRAPRSGQLNLSPPDLLTRVARHLEGVPDVRSDRVLDARLRLAESPPDAAEIAEKLLARIVSDRVR
jgi:hypothetical protein